MTEKEDKQEQNIEQFKRDRACALTIENGVENIQKILCKFRCTLLCLKSELSKPSPQNEIVSYYKSGSKVEKKDEDRSQLAAQLFELIQQRLSRKQHFSNTFAQQFSRFRLCNQTLMKLIQFFTSSYKAGIQELSKEEYLDTMSRLNEAQKQMESGQDELIQLHQGLVASLASIKGKMLSAIDRQFDGIIFPGFLGGANQKFREAAAGGMKVMAYNCDCSKDVPRVACLRPDPHEPGILGAKAAEKKLNGQGSVIMLVGDLTVNVNTERSEGFKMKIKGSKCINIAEEVIVPDNFDGVYKAAKEAIGRHPEAGIIFLTNGLPLAVVKAIRDMNKVGKTSLVCFDHNAEIFSEIKSGTICAAIGQDAFGQGHDPIIWLYNNIVAGDGLDEFIPCRLSVVDSSNVDSLIEA